jgi:hypothetical protein
VCAGVCNEISSPPSNLLTEDSRSDVTGPASCNSAQKGKRQSTTSELRGGGQQEGYIHMYEPKMPPEVRIKNARPGGVGVISRTPSRSFAKGLVASGGWPCLLQV